MGMLRNKMIFILTSIIVALIFMLGAYFLLIQTGVIQSRQIKLTIVAGSFDKPYDGEALECSSYKISYGSLRDDHRITVTYYGSQTEVGVSQSNVVACITDLDGVDVTKKYNIEYVPGTLTVGKRYLQISSASAEKYYDGTPLSDNGFEIEMGDLLRGHILKTSSVSEITNIGETENVLTATVLDGDGGDVTENYDIHYIYGRLAVLSNKLLVNTTPISKVYDGLPLLASGATHTVTTGNEMLHALNHRVEVEKIGEMTDVGFERYEIKVKVLDEKGEDVSKLYDITTNCGGMSVTPKEITISSYGDSKQYDGTPLTCSAIVNDPNEIGLISGDYVEAELGGTQTEVGSSANFFLSSKIYNAGGEDVTNNYKISYSQGTLTVTAINLNIQTGSSSGSSSQYNAQNPLTDRRYSAGTPLAGHTVEVEVISSLSVVGVARNDCFVKVVNSLGEDVSKYYNFIYEYGELEIFPPKQEKVLYFRTVSNTVTYDAMPHSTAEGVVLVDGSALSEGHQIVTGSVKPTTEVNAGVYDINVEFQVIDTLTGSDVTQEYIAGFKEGDCGKLTINPIVLPVYTQSFSKTYDGEPFPAFGSAMINNSNKLLYGHSIASISAVGSAEFVAGTHLNQVAFSIFDSNGNDVSMNYIADENTLGKLTINKALLVVTAQTNSREDEINSPLTVESYTVREIVVGDDPTIQFNSITYDEYLSGIYQKEIEILGWSIVRVGSSGAVDVSACYNVVLAQNGASLFWL